MVPPSRQSAKQKVNQISFSSLSSLSSLLSLLSRELAERKKVRDAQTQMAELQLIEQLQVQTKNDVLDQEAVREIERDRERQRETETERAKEPALPVSLGQPLSTFCLDLMVIL